VWFDRTGKQTRIRDTSKVYRDPSLSPDGKRIAAFVPGDSNFGDIWVLDLERNIETRLTFRDALRLNPIWSPDGSQIVYSAQERGLQRIFRKRADGGGQEELLVKGDTNMAPSDWSADGKWVVYEQYEPQTRKRDLWLLPMSGDRVPVRYTQTPFDEFQGQFSPDGQWMAFGSDESGNWEIYLQPIPATGGKWQVSNSGGTQPRWRADGRELYYLSTGGKLMSVSVKLGRTPELGAPKAMFPVRLFQNAIGTDEFVPTADGQRFLALNGTNPPGQSALTVMLNWTEGLEKP
jgi:Tol biopolymer transport system component